MALWEYAFLASLISSVSANVFQISPSNVTGLNGAQLGISCYADSNPSEVRWTKDGIAVVLSDSLRTSYAEGEGAVTFSPLGYQHEGVYRCTAYGSAGEELFSSYPGRVRVYGLPGFISPPSSVSVLQGGVGVFTCVVGSNPPGNTSWLFEGTVLQNNDKYLVLPDRLEVASVQPDDEGYYECLARNIFGTVPASARLTIVNEISLIPVAVVHPGGVVMVAEGSDLTLNCSASGRPTPATYWLRDGQVLGEGPRLSLHRLPGSSLLVVRTVSTTDGGTYHCYGNNSVGSDTEGVAVTVLVPPTLTAVPSDIIAHAGEVVVGPIVCEAQGVPPPVVVILDPQGGIVAESGVWTPPTPLTRDIGGTYQCVATNQVGQVNISFSVSIEDAPVITIPPQNATQFIGEEVVLCCEAEGPPPPQVVWSRLDNTSLPPNHNLIGTNLQLHSLSMEDSGGYRCNAGNALGTDEAVAWISVVARPAVKVSPPEVFVVNGGNFTLTCVVTPPTTGLDYTWFLEGTPLSETTPTFTVLVATAESAGEYTCQVALATPITASAQVIVGDPPQIALPPPPQVNLLPGNQYRFDCVVTGVPRPSVSWEFTDQNGRLSVLSDTESIRLYTNGSLYLQSVTRDDSGTYRCLANNGVGGAAAATVLRVEGAPLAVGISPNSLLLGGRGIVSCTLTYNYPVSMLTWLYPSNRALSVASNGSLLLDPVQLEDAGPYTCTASNSYGESMFSKDIVVYVPPKVSVPFDRVQVYLDSSVSVMCEGVGVPPPHVYWTTVQGGVVNSSVLELKFAALSDAGQYTCFGVNAAGASSTAMTVVVRGAPPTALMASVTKRNVSLSWQPPLYDASLLYYIVEYRETRENGLLYSAINTNSMSLNLAGFDEGTEHQFTVSGAFQGGVIGENATLLVTTLEDAPSAAPQNVMLSAQYSALTVTWQPPPVRDRNGVITGYNLYYRVTPSARVGVTSEPFTKLVVAPTVQHQLGGLMENTSYDVIMQAFTSAGSGPNTTIVMATALRLPLELILGVSIGCGVPLLLCCGVLVVCVCCCCYRQRKGKHKVGRSRDRRQKRKQRALLISGPIPDEPPFIDPDNPGKFAVRNRAGDLVVLQPKVVTADDIAPPPLEGQTAQPVRQVKLRQTAPLELYSEPQDSLARAGYSLQPARGSSEIQVVNQAFDYMSEFDDDTNPYAESPGGGAAPLEADAVLDAFVASQDKEILYATVPPEHVAQKREKKEQRHMAKVERKGWQAYQQRTRQPDNSGASDEELLLQDYSYGLPTLVEVDTHTSEGKRQQKRIDGAAAVMY